LLCEGNRQATLDIFKQRKPPVAEEIKKIHTPTLIIWGKDDQMIDVSNAYRFNENIKGSSIQIISNSGHVPMEETPQPVYEAIVKFIKAG
jgi:pimeloyl-ACP methyl ester carboxylesterase